MVNSKVCVVGAGISGVTCANILIQAGIKNVVIFEAQDRIGGRISTHYNSETPEDPFKIENGANWIHGHSGNPVFKVAQEHNLIEKIPCRSKSTVRYARKTLQENGKEIDKNLCRFVRGTYFDLEEKANTFFFNDVSPGYSENSSFQDFITKESIHLFTQRDNIVQDDEETGAKCFGLKMDLLYTCLKYETAISGCDSMSEVSLKQFGSYKHIPGKDVVIGQGYDKVVKALVQNIPEGQIHLNSSVKNISLRNKGFGCQNQTKVASNCVLNGNQCYQEKRPDNECLKPKIECENNSQEKPDSFIHHISCDQSQPSMEPCAEHLLEDVMVTLEDGSNHYFDHVIFTGSLGYLKCCHQSLFIPQLSSEKKLAITKLGFGTVDKIFLEFQNLDFFPEKMKGITLCWRKDNMLEDVHSWAKKINSIEVVDKPGDNMLMEHFGAPTSTFRVHTAM